jgi:lysophospholipase L1-like esterase
MPARWTRFVALGDSFTEGMDDLLPDGYPRGWADLVAAHFAAQDEDFRYANLAVRSRRIGQIVDEQLATAIAMRPDLTSIVAGGNDILGVRVSLAEISHALNDTVRTLAATGATVITFTGFDPAGRLPFGDRLGARVQVFNQQIRASAASAGAVPTACTSAPRATATSPAPSSPHSARHRSSPGRSRSTPRTSARASAPGSTTCRGPAATWPRG